LKNTNALCRQDALSELIVSVSGTPEVSFVTPSALGIEGKQVPLVLKSAAHFEFALCFAAVPVTCSFRRISTPPHPPRAHAHPMRQVSFGAVQHILAASYKSCALSIGFFEREKMTLCPAAGFSPLWHSGHRIIIIMRLPSSESE